MKKKRESVQRPGGLAGQAVKNLFEQPATQSLPFGREGIQKGYRGKLLYDPQNCINCVMCMRDCPTGAITIENKGTKEAKDMHAYLNVGRCVFCCQCVDTCPKKCLSFSSDVMLASFSRDSLCVEL